MSALCLPWLRTSSPISALTWFYFSLKKIIFSEEKKMCTTSCNWEMWKKRFPYFFFVCTFSAYLFNPANKSLCCGCRLEGRESCKLDGATALKDSAHWHQRHNAPWYSSHKCFNIMMPWAIPCYEPGQSDLGLGGHASHKQEEGLKVCFFFWAVNSWFHIIQIRIVTLLSLQNKLYSATFFFLQCKSWV